MCAHAFNFELLKLCHVALEVGFGCPPADRSPVAAHRSPAVQRPGGQPDPAPVERLLLPLRGHQRPVVAPPGQAAAQQRGARLLLGDRLQLPTPLPSTPSAVSQPPGIG